MTYQGPERRTGKHSDVCEQSERLTAIEVNASKTDKNVERIEKRVEEIRESQIRIEQSSIRVENFGNKIFDVMYGKDENGGLISTVQKIASKVMVHWIVISLILASLVALFLKK